MKIQTTTGKTLRQLEEEYDRLERAIRILEPIAESIKDCDVLNGIRLNLGMLGEVILNEYRSKGLIE